MNARLDRSALPHHHRVGVVDPFASTALGRRKTATPRPRDRRSPANRGAARLDRALESLPPGCTNRVAPIASSSQARPAL
jgi:hypothetical protein